MVLSRLLAETGILSLYASPRDVKLLCLMRLVRLAAYGASTLVLVSLLEARGVSKTDTGLFMTLTLAGDVAISLVLTSVADGVGRRAILGLGAALMVFSGIVFVLCHDFWTLLAAAVLGVISPSGNEIGPFRAIEESIVAHLTPANSRGDIYAWYSLLGPAGTAAGFMVAGWAVHHVVEGRGWEAIDAYCLVFVLYSALGLVKLVMVLCMSSRSEAEAENEGDERPESEEEEPLLGNGEEEGVPGRESENGNGTSRNSKGNGSFRRRLLPPVNKESAALVGTLCFLFGLDSFASGMAPLSWITFFYKSKYNLQEGKLGSVFFVTSIISAGSMLVASSIAKRIGNVKTMVFTHLPSSIFLALLPLPSTLTPSLVLLVLRACTQSMDSAPRSAFLAAALKPAERTAVMGLLNIVRTTAQTLSPVITGVLVDKRLFWVAFMVAGGLKCGYDLGMLGLLGGYERRKEGNDDGDEGRGREDGRRESDGDEG